MQKRLIHTRVVREAQDLLAEALARKPGGRRPIRPGMLIRYYFYGMGRNPPEAKLKQGIDRVELVRTREPRFFLQHLREWVFGRECSIVPQDRLYARHERQLEEKVTKSRTMQDA